MAAKTKHPLIKEIQLGKSPEELVREHFLSYDFQEDLDERLPDIVREIVKKNDDTLRFAVVKWREEEEDYLRDTDVEHCEVEHCEIVFRIGTEETAFGLDYWDVDHEDPEEAAKSDCKILNKIVKRLYGVKKKSKP